MRNIFFVPSILILLPLFVKELTDLFTNMTGLSSVVILGMLVITNEQIADRGSEQLKDGLRYLTNNPMEIPELEINKKYKRFNKRDFICLLIQP